jgi:uncharacterized protein YegJ (DUF2314 family)
MQRHHIAAALLLVVNLACTQPFTEWEKDYETSRVQDEALAMRQAAEKARATLDDFLVKAKDPPAGTKSYAVKVGVREAGGTEYFWVEELSWSDGSFMGRISDEPRLVKSVKPGQIHKFGRSDIVDWIYIDEKSGKTFGNFTACVRSSKNRPAQADELKRRNDLDCP